MQSLSRKRLLMALVLLAAALSLPGAAQGQAAKQKAVTKDVSFQTADGVKITGTLYPSPGGKREAVAMLLHSFDLKKGGSSQQAGWSDLAASLQKEGFTVLSFDFRGFGDSKTVDPDFWMHRWNNPNTGLVRPKKFNPMNPPTSIAHTDFNALYLPYLHNDIAAAKAYLDRRNDAKELNSGSVVVIGAGEGATLGAAWVANECRRKRDTSMPPAAFPLMAVLTPQAEVSDIAGCVWLTISPTLGGRSVRGSLNRCLVEAGGRKNKVPMAFVFGKSDGKGDGVARDAVKLIKPAAANKKDFTYLGSFAVPGTKLTGNALLDKNLDTENWIMKKYLDPVLEARGTKEQKDRKSEACQYWYINLAGRASKISKKAGQESPEVDVTILSSAFP